MNYLCHADKEAVDKVPWGAGVQVLLVQANALGTEPLQFLKMAEDAMVRTGQDVREPEERL